MSSNGKRPSRLLVVRHGESTWNAQALWQGQADPPLSIRGGAQAKIAAEALEGKGIERVVSSDLVRALKTGRIIAEHLGLGEVLIDEGFREVDVGEWSGLTRVQIEERWPGQRQAWAENKLESTPGGELLASFTDRVVSAVRRTARAHADEVVLMVGHSRVISTLERFVDVTPVRPLHLSGRWFEVDAAGELRGLDAVRLLGEIKEPTRS